MSEPTSRGSRNWLTGCGSMVLSVVIVLAALFALVTGIAVDGAVVGSVISAWNERGIEAPRHVGFGRTLPRYLLLSVLVFMPICFLGDWVFLRARLRDVVRAWALSSVVLASVWLPVVASVIGIFILLRNSGSLPELTNPVTWMAAQIQYSFAAWLALLGVWWLLLRWLLFRRIVRRPVLAIAVAWVWGGAAVALVYAASFLGGPA